MIMDVNTFKKLGDLCKEQLPTVLTGASVVGVIATGICSGKATLKAKEKMDDMENPTFKERMKAIIPVYAPTIVVGGTTIACILGAHHVSIEKCAAIASTYAVANNQIKEHDEKAMALLKQDTPNNNEVKDKPNIIFPADELIMCEDLVTGKKFKSNMTQLQEAAAVVNEIVMTFGSAKLSDFYDELGIECPIIADSIRWDYDSHPLKMEFGADLSDNGVPYLTFTYECEVRTV
jgi:hypothetical protein